MEIFALINVILTLGAMTVYGIRNFGKKKKKPAIVAAPAPKPLALTSGHRLVRTYVSQTDQWVAGWRFECSCGAKGTAANTVAKNPDGRGGKLGTESSAVDKFKIHRDNFISANGPDEQEHEDTVKLRKLEKEFEEWRTACFCKDTNDDLIVLKHRHLDSKPTTTVK